MSFINLKKKQQIEIFNYFFSQLSSLYDFTHTNPDNQYNAEEENLALQMLHDKDKIIPKYLYKYYSVTKYSLESLENQALFFQTPSRFNDPFDSKRGFTADSYLKFLFGKDYRKKNISKDEYELMAKEVDTNVEIFKTLQRQEYDSIDRFGVSCLSENSANILMWSHYASNHKGFCVEYDFHKKSIEVASLIPYLLPVLYSNRHRKVNREYFDLHINQTVNSLDYKMLKEEIFESLKGFFDKFKVWEYEREWRIALPKDNLKSNPYRINNINTVYIGACCEEQDEKHITEICEKINVPYKKVYIADGKYELFAM